MPTYDYRCRACDHRFELTQSMTAPVKRKCPECEKLQLERLIGIGAGFIIKGGGHSAKAEAAEMAKSEKESETATSKGSTKDSQDSAKSTSKSSETTSTDATAPEKKSETEKQPNRDKKLSGSTSTPTHAAREGRGVGNLVDKAKRRAKEASPSKSRKKRKQ